MADLDKAIAAAREALKVKSHPLDSRVTKTLRDLLAALAVPAERLGEQCADGGKCHHACTERCFRREHCGPFSDYTGPWAYEQAQQPAAAVPANFAEWLAREMPAGTVIGDPHWWANMIARRFAQFAAPPAAAPPRKPDGYAYRYPNLLGGTVLQFSNGEKINEAAPIEAVPYWLGTPPAAAVPDGYALVPVEPTEAMRDAFLGELWSATYLTHTTLQCADFDSRYRAMLAAALAAIRGEE